MFVKCIKDRWMTVSFIPSHSSCTPLFHPLTLPLALSPSHSSVGVGSRGYVRRITAVLAVLSGTCNSTCDLQMEKHTMLF